MPAENTERLMVLLLRQELLTQIIQTKVDKVILHGPGKLVEAKAPLMLMIQDINTTFNLRWEHQPLSIVDIALELNIVALTVMQKHLMIAPAQ